MKLESLREQRDVVLDVSASCREIGELETAEILGVREQIVVPTEEFTQESRRKEKSYLRFWGSG